jgi:hypothetical protein
LRSTATLNDYELQPEAAPCDDQCGYSGLFRSDHAFDDFISPVSNPVWFEDPRSLTEVRGVFVNHMVPEDSPLGGGDIQIYALQARLALTERLSVIAVKDGYVTAQLDNFNDDQGWGDLAAGLKYVFIRDTCNRFLLSGSVLYELSQGSREVFQGNGDGMWHFTASTAKALGEHAHFVGAAGWHLPNNGAQESQSLWYSMHLDYELFEGFYPLWELNGIHYARSGERLPLSIEGGDYFNLGSADVAGNHLLTTALGATKVFNQHLSVGAAWEWPLTGREDHFDSRLTATFTLRY